MPWDGFNQSLTINNLGDIDFDQMLEIVEPFLLEKVPEGRGKNHENMVLIDEQLGRFANLYSYLMYLYAKAAYETGKYYREDKKGDEYANWIRKKDALYEFAQAIELKWKACSRIITLATGRDEVEFDRPNYGARTTRAEEGKPKPKGWAGLS